MDLFKQNNILKATSYDFYETNIVRKTKTRNKDKKMLHKLSRTRLKRILRGDINGLHE